MRQRELNSSKTVEKIVQKKRSSHPLRSYWFCLMFYCLSRDKKRKNIKKNSLQHLMFFWLCTYVYLSVYRALRKRLLSNPSYKNRFYDHKFGTPNGFILISFSSKISCVRTSIILPYLYTTSKYPLRGQGVVAFCRLVVPLCYQ